MKSEQTSVERGNGMSSGRHDRGTGDAARPADPGFAGMTRASTVDTSWDDTMITPAHPDADLTVAGSVGAQPDARQLPPSWSQRFRPLGPVPGYDDAVHLHRYLDEDGREVVVKAVRWEPATACVWQLWEETDPTHVVPLVATVVVGDVGFAATHWQPHGSLLALMRENAPVDPATSGALVAQLAATLRHIHTELAQPLVHRNIAPSNILLAARPVDGPAALRLSDFAAAVTPTTPVDSAFSTAWDWWSLGMVVVELLGDHRHLDPVRQLREHQLQRRPNGDIRSHR